MDNYWNANNVLKSETRHRYGNPESLEVDGNWSERTKESLRLFEATIVVPTPSGSPFEATTKGLVVLCRPPPPLFRGGLLIGSMQEMHRGGGN